jgi:glycosyltransferase involved in cell wall biosynthesis
VLVVTGSDEPHDGNDVAWDRHGRLEVARLSRLPAETLDLVLARPRLEELVRALVEGCDVAHVHHWTTLSSGLVRALAGALPVVVTLHDAFAACARAFRRPPDPEVTCPRGGGFVPCVRCLAPDAGGVDEPELVAGLATRARAFAGELAAASALLAPSRFQARRMEQALGLAQGAIEVLPHGLCRDLQPPVARARRDVDAPLRVLHFGHLVEAKGILVLVRSLAQLTPGVAELDLAGAVLEPGLEERVRAAAGALPLRLHGVYGRRRLVELAAEADLAVFPSQLEETYGLVVDEAVALGLAVWVSDRGALPERLFELGGGGRVLPAGDVTAWTAAFTTLLARPHELAHERTRGVAPTASSQAATRLEELYAALTSART